MEAIRSWWEIPCIAHYCHIFAKPFKLPSFEIEELEDTLLLDECKEDTTPALLVKLYCSLLNGIVDKDVTEENWEFFLKMHLQWRTDYLDEKFNPHDGKTYKELTSRTKVDILHRICHWRMELDDVGDLLRGYDGSLLRVEPLGTDENGDIYWYFYGTRLYKEVGKKKRANNDSTPGNKGRGSRGGRGRNSTTPKTSRRRNAKEDKQENNSTPGNDLGGLTEDITGNWSIVCSTAEEWEELIETLRQSKKPDTKRLCNYLNDELLPDVLYLLQQKEKIFKKKLLAEMPRRTSDRIAQKAIKEEEERLEAFQREIQREEQRKMEEEERIKMEEEAEKKHQEKLEEVIKRRKAREEKQQQQRQKEEQNWSLALSGELSGPRKAAIGAVQGVVQTQHELMEDKDVDLYTDMYKLLTGLRKQEDSWVFEEPVTEDIAPGYFEAVETPMDFQTVEKKIEAGEYTARDQFKTDIELIFNNCKDYNGEESEYYELADNMLELFDKLFKQVQQESLLDEDDEEGNGKRKKKKSPSPELTSESSEESSDEDEGVDEDEEDEVGGAKRKKKRMSGNPKFNREGERLLLRPQMVHPNHPGGLMRAPHPHMYPPPHMLPQHMRGPPPHMPPEMMGAYPPHPYYGGGGGPNRPPFPRPNPMQMRPHPRDGPYLPPHPRDGPYPPPHEAYRYPYPPPMNGMPPPPPYGGYPPMMTPEQQMMHQRRMMGPGGYPMNGPHPMMPHPPPSEQQQVPRPHPPRPSSAASTQENPTKEGGTPKEMNENQRVSSPRVTSTVRTPPTSGDEKASEMEETKDKTKEDKKEDNKKDSSDEENQPPSNDSNKDDRETNNEDNGDKKDDSKATTTDNQDNSTKEQKNVQNTQPPDKMPHPPNHQQMPPHYMQHRGGGSNQQQAAMMDERQRYMHAMMIRRQQQQYMMAAAHHGYPPGPPPTGYPPPASSNAPSSQQNADPYYNWNRQQMPPPGYGTPPMPGGGPHPHHHPHSQMPPTAGQIIDRQKYMEYQMRMRAAAKDSSNQGSESSTPKAPPTDRDTPTNKTDEAVDSNSTKSSAEDKNESKEKEEQTNKKENEGTNEEGDVPDYHDSLTRYARGLASSDEESKQQKQDIKTSLNNDKSQHSSTSTPPPSSASARRSSTPHDGTTQPVPSPSDMANGPRPPNERQHWPHPSHPGGHMMPNGYEGHMMPPHPHYGHMMPPPHQQMYPHGGGGGGNPYGSHMPQYPPQYQDPGNYGMMSPDMEQQWRYMEMQRQWMAARHHNHHPNPPHSQHPSSQQHQLKGGLKRPLPNKPIPLPNTSNDSSTSAAKPNSHSDSPAASKGRDGSSSPPTDNDPTAPPPAKQLKLADKDDDSIDENSSNTAAIRDNGLDSQQEPMSVPLETAS